MFSLLLGVLAGCLYCCQSCPSCLCFLCCLLGVLAGCLYCCQSCPSCLCFLCCSGFLLVVYIAVSLVLPVYVFSADRGSCWLFILLSVLSFLFMFSLLLEILVGYLYCCQSCPSCLCFLCWSGFLLIVYIAVSIVISVYVFSAARDSCWLFILLSVLSFLFMFSLLLPGVLAGCLECCCFLSCCLSPVIFTLRSAACLLMSVSYRLTDCLLVC